jgi:ribonuclease VapC
VIRPLTAAVVDSSALMCIVKSEAAAPLFLNELARVDQLFISAVTLSEVLLAAMSATEAGVLVPMQDLIAKLEIVTKDYVAADVQDYIQAASIHHIKAKPPGRLNMGDIFSFQLAQKMGLPLFFQGLDFLKTPVKNAMCMRGYFMDANNKGVPAVQQLTN